MAELFQKVIKPSGLTLGALGLSACSADSDYASSDPVKVVGGGSLDSPQHQAHRPQLPTNSATYDPFVQTQPLTTIDPTKPIIIKASPIQAGAGSGLNLPPSADRMTSNHVPVSLTVERPRLITPHRPQAYHNNSPTAILRGKTAIAPPNVPSVIRHAIAAGNRMQTKPYRLGGGHSNLDYDNAYDCSGTTSYVLRHAGLLQGVTNSTGFMNYGRPGRGKFITIWAKPGHVFMEVCGLRLDTGGSLKRTGPRWKPAPRSMKGFVPRHPPGF